MAHPVGIAQRVKVPTGQATQCSGYHLVRAIMILSGDKAVWQKIGSHAEGYTAEALVR